MLSDNEPRQNAGAHLRPGSRDDLESQEAQAFIRAWNDSVIANADQTSLWWKRWLNRKRSHKQSSGGDQRRAQEAVRRARQRAAAAAGDAGEVRVDPEGVVGDGSVAGVGLSPVPEDSG